jgi:hypothetical protein
MPSRLLFCALIGAVAAGCGGQGASTPPSTPSIPRATGQELATGADAVAASLESGDACTAAARVARLQQAAQNAVSTGRVAVAFRSKLLTAVDALAAAVPACSPDHGHEHADHGKPKDHGEHGGGD